MSYTEEEIDYVIDKLDLGFMRNRIKQSPEDIKWMMGSFGGVTALVSFKFRKLIEAFRREK